MTVDHAQFCDVARQLARAAGAVILEIYTQDDLGERTKADDSPVTLADEAADALIAAGVREAFPNIPLVTEEQAATHDVSAPVFIIVDPLDGTKEFIKRRGDFTVNIALVEHGIPTRGVVFAPAKDRLFLTDASGQSYEEGLDGMMHKLSVSQPDPQALIAVASKSHRDAATDAYLARYELADSRSAGSSLKFCLIAAGEADFYPRLGRTMEWDTAAGDAVLRGAGGQMVRLDDLAPFTYGKPNFENPFFIAYAPGVPVIAGES